MSLLYAGNQAARYQFPIQAATGNHGAGDLATAGITTRVGRGFKVQLQRGDHLIEGVGSLRQGLGRKVLQEFIGL